MLENLITKPQRLYLIFSSLTKLKASLNAMSFMDPCEQGLFFTVCCPNFLKIQKH